MKLSTLLRAGVLTALSLGGAAAPLLAQPANDLCTAAETIAISSGSSGSVAGDNSAATDDLSLPVCTLSTSAGSGTKGVWYTFTGTGNRISFDTCNNSTDLTMRLYCSGCAVPVCAASDDDGCDGTNSLAPRLGFCSTAGTQYWLLVSRFGAATNPGAAFTLNWNDNGTPCSAGAFPSCVPAAPSNDECSGAIPVSIGGSVSGTTIDATAESVAPPTCSFSGATSVWYSFVGDGTTVTASTCNTITGSNTRVQIFTGTCGSLTCVSGNATASTTCADRGDAASTASVCTVLGQTYYVAVSWETNGAGLFQLSLTSSTCFPPPVNDNCSGAITIVPGVNQTGNTSQATNESPTPPTCSGFSTFNLGVWYTFTASNSNRYIASTCNPGTDFNTRVYVYSGSCGAFTCVLANAVASPACATRADAATVNFCANAGTTYYILVTNDTTGTGNYELSLTDTGSDCSPPSNDNCSGAAPISVGQTIVATNINATNESPAPVACNGFSTFNLGMWYTFTEGASARRLNVTTCDANTNFNTRVYVYTGSCGTFTCVNANAVASPACAVRSDAASVTFCSAPGTQYYFLVTNDTTGTGTFGVTLSDTGIGCNPPPNDLCANAVNITSVPFSATVAADTATNDLPDVSCNAAAATDSRAGVWYTYTPSEPGRFSFVETGTGDVVFSVFTGTCAGLTEVFCNTNETGTVFFNAASGTQYYILCSLASNTAALPSTYVLEIRYTIDSGACCVGTSCSIVNGVAACTTLGGTFQGYASSCGGGPLPENRNSTSFPMPDFPTGGPVSPVTSTINVTNAATITDLDVYVNMNHTFGGDVAIRLTGPNSVTVDLLVRPNIVSPCTAGVIGDADDLVGTYIFDDQAAATLHAAFIDTDVTNPIAGGRYQPASCTGTLTSLNVSGSGFGGISAAGTWTLTVSDEDEGVTGTLVDWGLVINGVEANTPCSTPTTGRCCIGARCAVGVTQANCVAGSGIAGTTFTLSATDCNASGILNAPCCFANYNAIGGITVQDIFDFLTDWFSGNPNANVAGDGVAGPTVQDIFDFLTAWFSGGC